MSRPQRTERGQATPLIAVVLVLAGLLLIPTGLLVRAAVERAEAQSAADAAALAGALDGASAARSVAAENGATLAAFRQDGDLVEVTVEVGGRRATARAERELVPARWAPDDPGSRHRLTTSGTWRATSEPGSHGP